MSFTGNYREHENFLLPPECKTFVKSADLAVAADDVLVAAQLGQPHGAPGVELLGGNAHLAAKAKLAAIRKAGRAVDIDRGAVHRGGKLSGMALSWVRMASLWPVEWAAICAMASSTLSTILTARM